MEASVSFLGNYNYPEMIEKLNSTNCDYIHFDVMDGKFVPNKNLSLKDLNDLLSICKKKKDIHLMVNNPSKYIELLSLFDISYITIHKEIKNYKKYIEQIKKYGLKVGLAINPETKVDEIKEDIKDIDLILIMSVTPGRSGQKFNEVAIEKIKELISLRKESNLHFKIEIDGGVNSETLQYIKEADIIVSATFILNNLENINVIKKIKE